MHCSFKLTHIHSREINQLYFCPLPPWVQLSCNIGFTFWMQVSLLLSLHCICVKSKTGTTRFLFGRMYMWASMRLGWHCHAMFWCTCLKHTSTPHKTVIPDTPNAFRLLVWNWQLSYGRFHTIQFWHKQECKLCCILVHHKYIYICVGWYVNEWFGYLELFITQTFP